MPRPPATYLYQDRQVTVADLAKLAGLPLRTMRKRLSRYPVDVALTISTGEARATGPISRAHMHKFGAESLTLREIAKRTGLGLRMLLARVQAGATAEQAVAAGQSRLVLSGQKAQAKANAPVQTARRRGPAMPPLDNPFDATEEVIIPPNVKRTVVKIQPGRFDPDPQTTPKIFSGLGLGRYEASVSAIGRAYA